MSDRIDSRLLLPTKEIWKEIPYAEGYEISSRGKIHNGAKTLKPHIIHGCEVIQLRTLEGPASFLVHRVMVDAFHGIEEGYVTHLNGDSLDNRIENLKRLPVGERGPLKNPNREGRPRRVCQLDENRNVIKIWNSEKDAVKGLDRVGNRIPACCKNPKQKFAKSYWQYEDHDLKNSLIWLTVTYKSVVYTVCKEGFLSGKTERVISGGGKEGDYLRYNGQFVHDIMATAFWLKPKSATKNKLQVNHLDGNKHNNNAENLEWVSGSENMEHYHRVLKAGVSSNNVPVISIDQEGKRRKYKSMDDAELKTGITRQGIGLSCSGKRGSAGERTWKYADKTLRPPPRPKKAPSGATPVNSIDEEGNKIRYESMAEAALESGVSRQTIGAACTGKRGNNGVLKWEYAKKITPRQPVEPSKPVNSIDKEGNKLRYKSSEEAESETGIKSLRIDKVCKGELEKAGGLQWEYTVKKKRARKKTASSNIVPVIY
jgi:hypothetical protein